MSGGRGVPLGRVGASAHHHARRGVWPRCRVPEYARRSLIRSAPAALRTGPCSLEDMTVAADPDPYFALPRLYGAPAYARAPKAVPESERPFDPDDLPIAAEQTDDERALAQMLHASGSYRLSGNGLQPPGSPHGSPVEASAADPARAAARRRRRPPLQPARPDRPPGPRPDSK